MLLSIIRQNQKLAAKRNPAFDRNRFAKFLIYFMVAFWAAYLIFIGVMLSFAFEDIFPSMEPYHIMNQGLIYLLILDFLLRFMLQPAMSQEIKPYLLMPVKKNKLVDTLLLQSGISSYNFFWFFLIIPFALLTIIRFYGLTGILCYLCGIWLLMVNRKLQLHFIYNEIAKVEDTKMKHVSEYKFLDRYGDVGEYLRLELKLCFRNKTVKTQFRMGFIIMLAFSALIAFTDVYDGTGMINFICIYNFAILSIMTLGQVMSFEGNYLDGLMSRKESIYNLLRAKYYLNCIIVFIPFLIMMIPVAKGKIPFLMALSYMLFTAGFVFAMMLQLAVYNKKTLPLNANVMRSNRGSSLFQTIIISCAFFLPLIINKALTAFFEQDTACIIMMIIGLLLIATHNIWIKNIYNRFMKRRYENMEGFRDSR